jgi:hypothetical protein
MAAPGTSSGVPAIHVLFVCIAKAWMPGTRPGMTAES